MFLRLARLLYCLRIVCILIMCVTTVLLIFWSDTNSLTARNAFNLKSMTPVPETGLQTTHNGIESTNKPSVLLVKRPSPPVTHEMPSKKELVNPSKSLRSLVDGSKQWMQLISAFYDDRQGLGDQACIRVIIIRDIRNTPSHCVLISKDVRSEHLRKAWFQKIGIGMPYKQFYFREEVFSCCVSRSVRPAFVKLVYMDSKQLKFDSNDVTLTIEYPEKPKEPPGTIINCLAAKFEDFDPKRIVEWLELQRLLGMDKVEIHDTNLPFKMRRIFDAYSKEAFGGLVKVHDINTVLFPYRYNLLYMSPAINACIYRNMYLYKAITSFDLDEVIFPRQHVTYKKLLEYLRNLTSDRPNKYPYFSFRNIYFYMNINVSRPKTWTSTFTRYIHHVQPTLYGSAMKSIIDPAGCFAMHNHFCWADLRDKRNDSDYVASWPNTKGVKVEIAANQHYKMCDKCSEDITQFFEDGSMLMFQDHLDSRIMEKFKALDL